MPTRRGEAVWKGTLAEGEGTLKFGADETAYSNAYSAPSRFEEGPGTNPEELIGAAHAACFSMALSAALSKAELTPKSIRTQASVHLEKVNGAWTITRIHLETAADVPGIDEAGFRQHAEGAKENCPVSRALGGVEISLDAKLVTS